MKIAILIAEFIRWSMIDVKHFWINDSWCRRNFLRSLSIVAIQSCGLFYEFLENHFNALNV